MLAHVRSPFGFPDPVNEVAARVVAGGVALWCALTLALGQPWLLVPLAYGFWARVLTGPTLSPLGRLATRVVAPRLGPARPVPGPPKRFAQGMGVAFSTTALVLWLVAGEAVAAWVVLALLEVAAVAECAFGYCLGCRVFALLMRAGIIPARVCEDCADLSVRHGELRQAVRA